MKKLNNKGFSIVELLAVIVIIGILGTVAIAAVTKYLNDASEKSYNTMIQSMQSATVNYREGGLPLSSSGGCKIDSKTLEEAGYLEKMKDPDISSSEENSKEFNNLSQEEQQARLYCTGEVYVRMRKGTKKELNEYIYKVVLTCPSGYEDTKYFPSSGVSESNFSTVADDEWSSC